MADYRLWWRCENCDTNQRFKMKQTPWNREVQEPFLQVRSFRYAVNFYPCISAQHLNWLVNHWIAWDAELKKYHCSDAQKVRIKCSRSCWGHVYQWCNFQISWVLVLLDVHWLWRSFQYCPRKSDKWRMTWSSMAWCWRRVIRASGMVFVGFVQNLVARDLSSAPVEWKFTFIYIHFNK